MNHDFWLEARNVSAFKNGFEIIRNLNLSFKYRENILLLGPNGSGKSSIVDLINRNLYPVEKEGSYLKILDKELINIWELRKNLSVVNKDIKDRINSNLNVFEIILSGLYGKYCKIQNPNSSDLINVKECIFNLNLNKIIYKKYSHLSDGEKQLTLIARAVINKPKLLILDEPSINLDIKSKSIVIDKLQELTKRGITLLCITHDVGMVSNIFNRVILLKDRSIIADGKTKDVLTSKNISNLFDLDINVYQSHKSWAIST